MRKSPSLTKSERSISQSRLKSQNKQSNALPYRPVYFCHYRNAMYMGGHRTNDKHGKALVFHDNGETALLSYDQDLLNGHCIFLTPDHEIISAQFSRNKMTEAVYKSHRHLLYIKYQNDMAEGDAVLISYEKKVIEYTRFHKGSITSKKVQRDAATNDRVFLRRQSDFLISKKHCRALKLQGDFGPDIQNVKKGIKITIGFMKNKITEGLAFTVIHRITSNEEVNSDPTITLSQRGMYHEGRLEGLGLRRFQNGNIYIGQLSKDLFQGSGMLLNQVKKQWITGKFDRNNLVQLNSHNSQSDDEEVVQKFLGDLHRRKSSWRDVELKMPDNNQLRRDIRKIELFSEGTVKTIDVEVRKMEVLRKIQNDFLAEQQQISIKTEQKTQTSQKKQINFFENVEDSTTKVKLKPLAITPDLRERLQKQENIYANQKQTESKALKPILKNNMQAKPQTNLSTSRKKIFDKSTKTSPKNTSFQPTDSRITSSSRRHRIFSTEGSRSRRSRRSREAHFGPSLIEPSEQNAARLVEEFSPIGSSRSPRLIEPESLQSSKRLVGTKIFNPPSEEQETISFRYSHYKPQISPVSVGSSRRNRIF